MPSERYSVRVRGTREGGVGTSRLRQEIGSGAGFPGQTVGTEGVASVSPGTSRRK